MPRRNHISTCHLHKSSEQAIVTRTESATGARTDRLLGRHGMPATTAELEARGRRRDELGARTWRVRKRPDRPRYVQANGVTARAGGAVAGRCNRTAADAAAALALVAAAAGSARQGVRGTGGSRRTSIRSATCPAVTRPSAVY
jgi:hypothetical protein